VTRRTLRPGFAAPLAACMLAAVATLAAASFHTVVQGRRAATRLRAQEQAASAADLGLDSTLRSWDVERRDSLAIGALESSAAPTGDRGGVRVLVTRVTLRLFWIEAAARTWGETSVEARRIHHLLVEVLRPAVPTSAALISRGDVLLGADAVIDGTDTPPPWWNGCPAPVSSPASSVIVPDGALARDHGGAQIPGASVDEAAGRTETYERLGDLSRAQLAERADLFLPPGAIVSLGRDSDRLTVIHASGDLVVTGAGGSGVLLIDGRLFIRGPFEFAGVILAGGGIEASGPGVSLYGTVLSAGAQGVLWRAEGGLWRSTCATSRAIDAAARPFVVRGRGWAELF
jgi:hypothetical protein